MQFLQKGERVQRGRRAGNIYLSEVFESQNTVTWRSGIPRGGRSFDSCAKRYVGSSCRRRKSRRRVGRCESVRTVVPRREGIPMHCHHLVPSSNHSRHGNPRAIYPPPIPTRSRPYRITLALCFPSVCYIHLLCYLYHNRHHSRDRHPSPHSHMSGSHLPMDSRYTSLHFSLHTPTQIHLVIVPRPSSGSKCSPDTNLRSSLGVLLFRSLSSCIYFHFLNRSAHRILRHLRTLCTDLPLPQYAAAQSREYLLNVLVVHFQKSCHFPFYICLLL